MSPVGRLFGGFPGTHVHADLLRPCLPECMDNVMDLLSITLSQGMNSDSPNIVKQ